MIPRRIILLLDDYETGMALLSPAPTPFYGYHPPSVTISKDNRTSVEKDNRSFAKKDNQVSTF